MTYDAADGFKVVTYDETGDIDAASAGDLVKVSGDTVSGDVELLGLVSSSAVGGSGNTLSLGKTGSGQAATAGLYLGYPNSTASRYVDPDLDFGTSEGIIYALSDSRARWRICGSIHGTGGLTLYPRGSTSTSYALRLQGTNNTVSGEVTILPGRVIITGTDANGFGANTDVTVTPYGRLDIDVDSQTYSALRGAGNVELASGRTVTVNDEFEPGEPGNPMDFVNQGEVVLAGTSASVFNLDATSSSKDICWRIAFSWNAAILRSQSSPPDQ